MSVHARIALTCFVGLPAICAGAQTYDLQLLGTRGNVEAIGRTGDVALIVSSGDGCEVDEAAVYRDGRVDILACGAGALGVNAGGDVVGSSGSHGKLWTRSGSEVDILAPQPNHDTSVRAINDSGVAVGSYSRPHRVTRCFAWTQQDGSFDLGLPDGATSCTAEAINNRSWISGYVYVPDGPNWFGFIWKNGHFHVLPMLDGMQFCQAMAINRPGDAVGACYTYGALVVHPVLWKDGKVIDLYPAAGHVEGYAYGINDAGVIVGTLSAGDWHGGKAVIYGDTGPVDLAKRVRNMGDYTFTRAIGIDKSGEIAANVYSPTLGSSAVKVIPVGNLE